MNKKLLNITLNKNKTDILHVYELFISEYTIWILLIVQQMSHLTNDSKQYLLLKNILNLFMNLNDIKQWVISSKKSNLSYWIPVNYTDKKGSESFFIDLIGLKDDNYTVPKDNNIIVKFKTTKDLNDRLLCWKIQDDTSGILEKDSLKITTQFIENYLKSTISYNSNSFDIIKNIIDNCNFKYYHFLAKNMNY